MLAGSTLVVEKFQWSLPLKLSSKLDPWDRMMVKLSKPLLPGRHIYFDIAQYTCTALRQPEPYENNVYVVVSLNGTHFAEFYCWGRVNNSRDSDYGSTQDIR